MLDLNRLKNPELKDLNREFILKIIKDQATGDLYDSELFFCYNYNDIKAFKQGLKNGVYTIGDLRKKIYKEFSLMPSILMTISLNVESSYLKYFKTRFNIQEGLK